MLQRAVGPELWRTQPINLRQISISLGHLLPASSESLPTATPQLGLDYLPPLNAQAALAAPRRTPTEDRTLLANSGLGSWDALPEAFSWHDLALLQQVKQWTWPAVPILPPPSQYGCGACWAFAIVTALSDRFAIFSGRGRAANPNLSPSFVLSCMGSSERCNGGFPADGGRFLETQGTVSNDCWDYGWCTSNPNCVSGTGSATSEDLSRLVPPCTGQACTQRQAFQLYRALRGSTQALVDRRSIQIDVLEHGPVAAVARIFGDFVAGSMASKLYPRADGWARTRGVYVHVANTPIYDYGSIDCLGAQQDSAACFMGNHAMVIVGWGVERGVPQFLPGTRGATVDLPYWVVRNSWGPLWNGDGYCKIAMSDPNTGINMEVALDRPLRIGTEDFGAVTTILPDTPNLNTFRTLRTNQVPQHQVSHWWSTHAFTVLVVCVVCALLFVEYLTIRHRGRVQSFH